MDTISGKHFSITDPQGVNTVIYRVNKTEEQFLDKFPKYTVERLDMSDEFRGDAKRRTFYLDDPKDDQQLVIFSFGHERVVVNSGLLDGDKIKILKKPIPIKLDSIYSEKPMEYREFKYTPNLKRPISIIDPETTEEIKPIVYLDKETNEVKGKCKLKPYKSYFAFEIRDDKDNT